MRKHFSFSPSIPHSNRRSTCCRALFTISMGCRMHTSSRVGPRAGKRQMRTCRAAHGAGAALALMQTVALTQLCGPCFRAACLLSRATCASVISTHQYAERWLTVRNRIYTCGTREKSCSLVSCDSMGLKGRKLNIY